MCKSKDTSMKDAFAKEQKLLESCQAPFSFYQLVENLWHPKSNIESDPISRLCTLMRKMEAKSFIREELELNEELLEERNMATKRCKQSVGLTATRLTFFRSLPSPSKLISLSHLHFLVFFTLTESSSDSPSTMILSSIS